MKNFKRMLALLLTVCMVLSLVPAAFAGDMLANEDEVIVYYTNDVHTYIDGTLSYDNVADLKAKTAEQAAGVLLVDAGDHAQGTAYGSMDKGETIIKLMNAAGYDLATLGNHEFDYGMEQALANVEAAEFTYLSSNFYHEYKNPFTDVPAGKWYTEHVAHMDQWGIINGMTDTTYGPMNTLTRAQFATMLYRIAGEPDVSKLDNPFTDVPEGKYYTDAVKFLYELEVITGKTATTFAPNDPITREMMVTILWRVFEEPEVECDLSAYADLGTVSSYAVEAMRWAVYMGVINGMSDTKLGPKVATNRAMAAKVLDICFFGTPKYETVLPAYEIKEIGGMRIAFVGVTTPETFTKSTPAYFQNENGEYIYGIAGGDDGYDLYDTVQITLDELIYNQDVDYIIGLGHLGVDEASSPWTSKELIANTYGFDAFIDGHSHSSVPTEEVLDADGMPVILTQTGEYFNAIGRMVITEDGIETSLITAWEGSDEEVAAIKNEWITKIDEQLGEVIGHAEVTFDNYDETGRLVRKMETNTGDFAADALYYLFDNMGLDVDVAIMNGGGVRNKAITGDISYKTCKEIHTFGNVACLQTITGQQLLDALEWGARDAGTGKECGGFLHVSGITYEIHPYIETTVQKDDKGVWTGAPTGEYRVKNVKILQDGEYVDLDLEAKYNLAGYNYTLRDLGDGFAMFDGAVNVLDYVMEDYMVLANYVKSFPVDETTGLPTITADNSPYGDVYGEGRITFEVPASEDEIVIYYTNDVHTYIDNDLSYDNLANLKQVTADYAAGVLLLDAGDHVQGTAYGSMDKGKTIIDLMNAAGYDVATLGNHEFDYGMDGAMNVVDWANYPYVSANFYHEKDGVAGDTVLDAYKVFEVAGMKIAIVGVTTPETFTKSTPAYFQDENGNYIYGIAGGEDGTALYTAVQAAIDAASAEADLVIGLGHLGVDEASQPWTSKELIANTTGFDAFIDGHSHSSVPTEEVLDAEGNTVLLTQTGEYFDAIGKMTITSEGITAELITEWAGSDEAVAAIKNEWIAAINEQLGEVIGYAEVTFDNYDETGRLVRKMETNTGDFAADALYYLFDNMGLDVDVAIMNGGGVRNKAITGEISYLTCKQIHTFGNVACLQTITGQQLLDALEWGARGTPNEEVGGFLHVAGITYEIDSTIESTVQMDEKGVWVGAPTGEYRVKNVKILQDGEYVDLDLEATYNLAGYNYTLRDLGDGFAMFDGAVNVLDYVMEDYMVLANYVKSFEVDAETGLPTITAENSPYGSVYGAGRITIK